MPPTKTSTLSTVASFSTAAAALSALPSSSTTMSSSFLPSTPPAALISSTASWAAALPCLPVISASVQMPPILMVLCAYALPTKSASTASANITLFMNAS